MHTYIHTYIHVHTDKQTHIHTYQIPGTNAYIIVIDFFVHEQTTGMCGILNADCPNTPFPNVVPITVDVCVDVRRALFLSKMWPISVFVFFAPPKKHTFAFPNKKDTFFG